jgi:hypothetical protein
MLGTLRNAVITILALGLFLPAAARADQVGDLISRLESSDYKIRISAAANLGKVGDRRAVEPLITALGDSNKSVRSVAATSLGKVAQGSTPAKLRSRALEALRRAAAKDPDSLVRKQAKRALGAIDAAPAQGAGGIYVDVGSMTDKASKSKTMRELMRKTVEQTVQKNGSSMFTSWPGGKPPSAKQIAANKTSAFHVDGTLVSLSTESKGATTLVSCKISMLIATYPKKSMFGFLDGGAKVQAGSSPREVQFAQEDCVAAVIEDLVSRKIIPTIKTRVP